MTFNPQYTTENPMTLEGVNFEMVRSGERTSTWELRVLAPIAQAGFGEWRDAGTIKYLTFKKNLRMIRGVMKMEAQQFLGVAIRAYPSAHFIISNCKGLAPLVEAWGDREDLPILFLDLAVWVEAVHEADWD